MAIATGMAAPRRLSLQDIRAGARKITPRRPLGRDLTGFDGREPAVTTTNAPVPASATRAGPPPDDRYAGFYATPGYQFRLDEGARAIENSAAARGRLFSGGTIKGLTRFAQGTASNEFQNYVRGLQGLAQVGGGAASQGASGAIATGRSIGSAYENAGIRTGSAYAQGAEGVGNAVIGGIDNLAYIYGRRF